MASTTFSGPIKAGTIANTTGTTLGDDVKNTGQVVMCQSVAVTQAATSTETNIVIPANSQIISVDLVVEELFANSSTTTIAIGNATGTPTNLCPATNVSATALDVSMGQAAVGVFDNTGSSDIELFGITVANSANAGKARIVVTYAQNNNLTGF